MRSTLLLICACCILAGNCLAQINSDSLRQVMASKKTYAEKIAAYLLFEEKFGPQNPEDMLRLGKEGLALAIKNDDPLGIAEMNRYIGDALSLKNQFASASTYYLQAISLLENTKEKKKLAMAYSAMAKLYRKTGELDKAKSYYEKAYLAFSQSRDQQGMAQIQNEWGVVYEYSGDYVNALAQYNKALSLSKSLSDSTTMAGVMSNMASVYRLQKNYREAAQFLQNALTIRKALKDSFSLALLFSDLAAIYVSESKFEQARNYIDSSNRIADRWNYFALKANNFNLLTEMAQQQGDYKNALRYFSVRAAIRDSLFGLEKSSQLEELSNRYETVKKEQKVLEQQHRLSLQNIIITGGTVIFLLLVLLTYAQFRRMKWKQKALVQTAIMRQQQLATKAVMEAEEAERQRIARDLHDSIGQMMSAAKMNLSAFEHTANFQSSGQRQSFEKVMTLIDDSCKEIRSVSHHMMPAALLKKNLDTAVRDFLAKLDQQHLQVQLHTAGLQNGLDSNTQTVLYRVIQECVNNVIKHSNATTLDISITREKNEVNVLIQDNGKGFNKSLLHTAEGIGLKNIRTRIEYLKGTVDFDTAPGRGTVIAIFVPATG